MINSCYRAPSFVDNRGSSSFTSGANLERGTGYVQTSFTDKRFMAQNEGQFLYDENNWKQQNVGSDVSCPLADNILNACNAIIDAAQYIGVTFDITDEYSQSLKSFDGSRG